MKFNLQLVLVALLIVCWGCEDNSRMEKSKLEIDGKFVMLDGKKFNGVAYEKYTNGKLKNQRIQE